MSNTTPATRETDEIADLRRKLAAAETTIKRLREDVFGDGFLSEILARTEGQATVQITRDTLTALAGEMEKLHGVVTVARTYYHKHQGEAGQENWWALGRAFGALDGDVLSPDDVRGILNASIPAGSEGTTQLLGTPLAVPAGHKIGRDCDCPTCA